MKRAWARVGFNMSTLTSPVLSHRDFFAAVDADYKAGVKSWRETTEEVYHDMLNALPPAYFTQNAFSIGEPYTHDKNNRPVFTHFVHIGTRYFGLHCTLSEVRTNALPPLPAV